MDNYKIYKEPFYLKSELSVKRDIPGGIDYYEDQITLEYPQSLGNTSITLSLITITGLSFSTSIILDSTGYMKVSLESDLKNTLVEHHFDILELKSKVDITVIVSIEKQDGGFQ